MIDEMISAIGRQLNITQSSDYAWICRAIYSAAGKIALASLWDHTEDENSISIQHFKKRAARIFDAYTSIYPQTRTIFPDDREELVNDIYEVYRRTGHFYHASHELSPAVSMSCESDGALLYRGISPDSKCFMSGLGFYGVKKDDRTQKSVTEMFGLQMQPMKEYLHELLQNGAWAPIECPDGAQFLRIKPPFSRGYWQDSADMNGKISLVRYGEPNKIYAFYRFEQGQFLQKPIPEWRVNDFRTVGQIGHGEYRRIAIALLDSYGELPAITVKRNGHLVEIHVGYRLPPSEEDFFKLYSWPSSYNITSTSPQVFVRYMSAAIYPLFKHQLETIGYRFVEE